MEFPAWSCAMIGAFRSRDQATMHAFGRWAVMVATLALAGGGCSEGGDGSTTPIVPQVPLNVERVFPALTFDAAVAMLQAPGDNSGWFVVEQPGRVRSFANNDLVATTTLVIDISARVNFFGELGLLGMAFHPNFPADPRAYLFYSHTEQPSTVVTRISEFHSPDGVTLDESTE